MAKEITFDTTARDKIKKGVDKLANAVKLSSTKNSELLP
jgi:chaperonin GroEL